jgi:hypothetical protein
LSERIDRLSGRTWFLDERTLRLHGRTSFLRERTAGLEVRASLLYEGIDRLDEESSFPCPCGFLVQTERSEKSPKRHAISQDVRADVLVWT